jgi:hypothetical protein
MHRREEGPLGHDEGWSGSEERRSGLEAKRSGRGWPPLRGMVGQELSKEPGQEVGCRVHRLEHLHGLTFHVGRSQSARVRRSQTGPPVGVAGTMDKAEEEYGVDREHVLTDREQNQGKWEVPGSAQGAPRELSGCGGPKGDVLGQEVRKSGKSPKNAVQGSPLTPVAVGAGSGGASHRPKVKKGQ